MPEGVLFVKTEKIGIHKERLEQMCRDEKVAPILATIRVLPPELVDEFEEEILQAMSRFRKKHGCDLLVSPTSLSRKNIEKKLAASLAECAFTVAEKLGLSSTEVLRANELAAREFFDSEGDPSDFLISIELLKMVGNSALDKLHAKKRDLLTYIKKATYSGGRNENSSNTMQKIAISQRIKSAREKLGLSQGQAAEKWNLRLQTLQQWEHGRREPRGLYRERIETILSEIEGAKAGK